ncbi:MAG: hypothetical protein RLZZ84_1386 [Pseudomonadota bacterium]|jgi:ribosomal protein L37E
MTDTPDQPVQQKPADAIPEKQFEQLIEAINDRVPNAAHCRSCGKNQVSIAPHAVSPLIVHNGGTTLGGTTYPQIMLICGHCGETRYHNAVILGIQLRGDNGG